jgi:hypothetical protein
MVTILFIAALVFAIPTYGLSLIAYFGFLVASRVLKAKERMHYADTQRALRHIETAPPERPSWGSNKHTIEVFSYSLTKMATRNEVPAAYVNTIFQELEFIKKIMSLVAALERSGSSFVEQQMAAADFVLASWNRLSDQDKAMISDL